MTLTLAQLRLHVDTALGDVPLAALLAAAYQTIEQRAMPAGVISELLSASGDLLMLSRVADVVSTVTENGRELDEDAYELRPSGQMLRRLPRGTRWRGYVDVQYLPADDQALRDSIAVELVKLDVNTQHGISQQTIGSWSESYEQSPHSYSDRREAILCSLSPEGVML